MCCHIFYCNRGVDLAIQNSVDADPPAGYRGLPVPPNPSRQHVHYLADRILYYHVIRHQRPLPSRHGLQPERLQVTSADRVCRGHRIQL